MLINIEASLNYPLDQTMPASETDFYAVRQSGANLDKIFKSKYSNKKLGYL